MGNIVNQSIREAYGEALIKVGSENDKIVVLDADVSNSTRTILFAGKYHERFYNVGIAEANMMSIAAGMAAAGLVPFVNTFAFIATLRAGDQIRSQIAYSKLNVKIAGAYSGLSDFADGASHQSVLDIAIVRSMPNMTVIIPSDAYETEQAVMAASKYDGPVYLRLSRAETPSIFDIDHPFEIGKGRQLKEGYDATIIAVGYMVYKSLKVAEKLEEKGIHVRVIEMPTIKPIDRDIVIKAAKETGCIVAVEEHSIFGGLGSAISEVTSFEWPVPIEFVGIPDRFGESGQYEELLEKFGLGVQGIMLAVENVIEKKLKFQNKK